jgi:hypothetical protein
MSVTCQNRLVRASRKFTVLIERDEDGYYVATVPALRGCHTQAKNLNTPMKRVRELWLFACTFSDRSVSVLVFLGIPCPLAARIKSSTYGKNDKISKGCNNLQARS